MTRNGMIMEALRTIHETQEGLTDEGGQRVQREHAVTPVFVPESPARQPMSPAATSQATHHACPRPWPGAVTTAHVSMSDLS